MLNDRYWGALPPSSPPLYIKILREWQLPTQFRHSHETGGSPIADVRAACHARGMERSYRDANDVLALLQDTIPYLGTELRDVDQPGLFGDTPLIQVMTWNDVAAASLLLEAGADIAAKGEDGNTALHMAASFGYPELVTLLLAKNAPISVKNDKGCTPAETANEFGNDEIAALLGGQVG